MFGALEFYENTLLTFCSVTGFSPTNHFMPLFQTHVCLLFDLLSHTMPAIAICFHLLLVSYQGNTMFCYTF